MYSGMPIHRNSLANVKAMSMRPTCDGLSMVVESSQAIYVNHAGCMGIVLCVTYHIGKKKQRRKTRDKFLLFFWCVFAFVHYWIAIRVLYADFLKKDKKFWGRLKTPPKVLIYRLKSVLNHCIFNFIFHVVRVNMKLFPHFPACVPFLYHSTIFFLFSL